MKQGLIYSLMVHAALFGVGGWVWARPAAYGVTSGVYSAEVELVAAPEVPAAETILPAERAPESEAVPEAVEEPRMKPQTKPAAKTVPASPPASPARPASSGGAGAQIAARPNYLRNPAPAYPEAARRNGEEGVVILVVRVGRDGRPMQVELGQTSGHRQLDQAALRAVKKWFFEPARIGALPVESTVQIPVRFRIKS